MSCLASPPLGPTSYNEFIAANYKHDSNKGKLKAEPVSLELQGSPLLSMKASNSLEVRLLLEGKPGSRVTSRTNSSRRFDLQSSFLVIPSA